MTTYKGRAWFNKLPIPTMDGMEARADLFERQLLRDVRDANSREIGL